MKTVVTFRGRNTVDILEDAKRFGILDDDDRVIVVCRKNDQLAQTGDVLQVPYSLAGDVVLVANGGTTAQLVPAMLRLMAMSQSSGDCQGEPYPPDISLRIVEVQRDGISWLRN